MFELFRFDLPKAITNELSLELETLGGSPLNLEALERLREFQDLHETRHGVYLLMLDSLPVYLGKADNLAARLESHYEKLRGRINLDLAKINFKALVLEISWSTSANEALLIADYKSKGQCEWNGTGFGPKDPGRNRDGHKPGAFDLAYPINDEWMCDSIPDKIQAGVLLGELKDKLPYGLRYEISKKEEETSIDLRGVPRNAKSILIKVAEVLGPKWQLMRFNSHITLYQHDRPRDYAHGTQLFP